MKGSESNVRRHGPALDFGRAHGEGQVFDGGQACCQAWTGQIWASCSQVGFKGLESVATQEMKTRHGFRGVVCREPPV